MIIIEKIKKEDLPELAVLFKELSGCEQNTFKMNENFDRIVKSNDYIVLGAKIEGKLAGSLMGIVCMDIVDECRPFMLIENVIVLEKYRRQGIGRELMRNIENICIERSCSYIIFVSGAQRKEAHKFYESAGYNPDEVRGFKKYFK